MLILRLFIAFLSGYFIYLIAHIYITYFNNNHKNTNINLISELHHLDKVSMLLPSIYMVFLCTCLMFLCSENDFETWQVAAVFSFCACLLMIAYIDMKTMLIPNRLLIVLLLLGLPFFLQPLACSWLQRFYGAAVPAAFMSLMNYLHHDSFGFGDIKLMLICGFVLGAHCVLLAMLTAILSGGAYGVCLLLVNKTKAHSHIAFAPFLCSALILSLLFGNEIIAAYMKLLYSL